MARPGAAARILLIEDDTALRLALSDRLKAEGYAVDAEENGLAGAERAAAAAHDLIVLDLMLPDKGGLEIARDLRHQGNRTPILMLTARVGFTDKVVGLNVGADDYLTKPFEFVELLARIQALLRRASWVEAGQEVASFHSDDLSIDFTRAEVQSYGRRVELSAREWKLLRYFVSNPGVVLSRSELLDAVWEYDSTTSTRTVDVHVARLRQKLEAEPDKPAFIQTVRGLGYKFAA